MYKSFILPIFDYADVIWNNCTNKLSTSLEKLHLEAIRIITGAVRGTSHTKLYQESGFCPLKERRKRHKLIFFHKLVHGNVPKYIKDLLPPLVSDHNPYPSRHPNQRVAPRCRTETYATSSFPSTTKLWNELSEHHTNTTSLSHFKHLLNSSDITVPPSYLYGKRKNQTLHCRLRLQISDLNSDLYKRHLIENPGCNCGNLNENAEHFLLLCPNYTNLRLNTIDKLPEQFKHINTFLSGDTNLNTSENQLIFRTVQEFIEKSR